MEISFSVSQQRYSNGNYLVIGGDYSRWMHRLRGGRAEKIIGLLKAIRGAVRFYLKHFNDDRVVVVGFWTVKRQ